MLSHCPNFDACRDVCDRPRKRCCLQPPHEQRSGCDEHSGVDDRAWPLDASTEADSSGPDQVVCYGMIEALAIAAAPGQASLQSTGPEPAILGPRHTVQRGTDGQELGTLDDYAAEALLRLADDGEIELQLNCSTRAESARGQRGKRVRSLDVILYGPRRRADNIGDFVGACGYYLQDPSGCSKNVVYFNPHRLACLDGYAPLTFDLPQHSLLRADDFTRIANDILAQFETTGVLDEEPTPQNLRTPLKVHQKQALAFLKRREFGLNGQGNDFGIWARHEETGAGHVFLNTITDQKQSHPPPIWRGGILADDMGLGKTLTIIALIATDVDTSIREGLQQGAPKGEKIAPPTLIIVPPNVISVWETQLLTHVHTGKIRWMKHHGQSRFDQAGSGRPPDIVLTTYQTIEHEHRKARCREQSVFSLCWKRIVLDEAHLIRNWKSSTAKAVASLNAASRWAISGTPIQNSLSDFFGVFKFLRFQPYDEEDVFDKDLLELWRKNSVEQAAERFKRLLSCIMIRRHKSTATVDLPPRYDRLINIAFDADEEKYYRTLEQPKVDFYGMDGNSPASSNFWTHAMKQMLALRMVCNLGLSTLSASLSRTQPPLQNNDICDNCSGVIGIPDVASELGYDYLHTPVTTAYYSQCFLLFCFSCAELLDFVASGPCACGPRVERCSLKPMSSMRSTLSPSVTPSSDSASPEPTQSSTMRISSKVRALLYQIITAPMEKHVVFSFWTSSLDMVQQALESPNINIPCVRIDGTVAPQLRRDRLHRFRTAPEVRVILITISCGAVGLDLTVASRVHILEPQWNPSIEQQAMDRIHRIGQTRAVTTFRYVMENSVEEHIHAVQDRKKLLTTLLLTKNV